MLDPNSNETVDLIKMVIKLTSSILNEDVLAEMIRHSAFHEQRDLTSKLIDLAIDYNIEFNTNKSRKLLKGAMEHMAYVMGNSEESDFSYLFYILRNRFNIEPAKYVAALYNYKIADFPNLIVNK